MQTLSNVVVPRSSGAGVVRRTLSAADVDVLLSRSRLFRGVGADHLLERFSPQGEVCLRKGMPLLELGQRNALLYVLMSGRLGVYLDEGATIAIAHLQPGDCVGEISIVDEEATSACVVALEPSRLLVASAAHLWDLISAEPVIAANLLHVMAERIRCNNASLLATLGQQARLGMQAVIDPVTGLHNRRWLNDVFVRQIERCARGRLPVSIAVIDIDHFKSVNDTFGHQAGDGVLAQLGRVLQRQFRPTDLIARCGGGQFAVLLPETGSREAVVALERLRVVLAQTQTSIAQRTTVKVSVSVGIAEWCADWSLDELMQRANQALRRAKATGRNRVLVSEDLD